VEQKIRSVFNELNFFERGSKMNIQDKAMLVQLNVSQWTARKMDRGASQATADLYHAEGSEVSTYKSTVQKKHLDKIQKIVGKARTMHYKYTSPFPASKGQAVLATKMLTDYMSEGGTLVAEFNHAVEEFMTIYRTVQEEAKAALGDLYDEFDYPSEEKLRRKFAMAFDFAPIPQGSHLQIAIGADDLAEMQADIEAKVKDSMTMAMDDLWQRVYRVTSQLKERMTPEAGKDKVFRDTLISNISELAEILPKMNISGDADLDAIAAELSNGLAAYDPEALRKDRGMRKEAAKRADAILDKVSRRLQVAPSMPVEVKIAPVVIEPVPVEDDDEMTAKLKAMGII
jgi:hypothetical protein